jgi:hypothetical protein
MSDLPRVRVGTIGHVDHGKASLSAALAALAGHALVVDSEDQVDDPIPLDTTGKLMEEALSRFVVSAPEPVATICPDDGRQKRYRAAARAPSPLTHAKRRAAAKRARKDRKRAARGRK